MFISNVFYLFVTLYGVNYIFAEEHEPAPVGHDDRRFRFPFNSVGIQLSREGVAAVHQEPGHQDPVGQASPNSGESPHSGHDDRRFRFPFNSVGITLSREIAAALHNESNSHSSTGHASPAAGEAHSDGEEAPHTNHDDRRFRFPFNSVGITLSRDGEVAPLDGQHGPADRGLFSLLPRLVPCNQTEQGVVSCNSCSEVLICFSNNIGIRRSCGPLHCNHGVCSLIPSPACNSTV